MRFIDTVLYWAASYIAQCKNLCAVPILQDVNNVHGNNTPGMRTPRAGAPVPWRHPKCAIPVKRIPPRGLYVATAAFKGGLAYYRWFYD